MLLEQFIYDLPTRLQKCIKSEAYAEAVKFYTGATPIFKVFLFTSSIGGLDLSVTTNLAMFAFHCEIDDIELCISSVTALSLNHSFLLLSGIWGFFLSRL